MAAEKPSSIFRDFLDSEAAGGVILMVTAALALVIANSPLSGAYFAFLQAKFLGMSVLHGINDGLMAVFFLLVGLEIKREVLGGQLSNWSQRILPGLAALGGMVVPALVFLALNAKSPETVRGWAVPTATDIAFALGVLALLGPRVPASLKIFLTALAIIDDLGAVLVIALFYTAKLSWPALVAVAAILALLAALNRLRVRSLWPYLLVGAGLWGAMLQSGVHATVAGIALALTIPMGDEQHSPLHRLEHGLAPWVGYGIVPIFGFANAGVSFAGLEPSRVLQSLPLGIALGLLFGKQIGVFGTAWMAIWLGFAARPEGAGTAQLYGVAVLCGIGFTMSLFIGALAFGELPASSDAVKVGVLAGSALSAILGSLVLLRCRSSSS
ncbi:Na+/H+ antiporter NhaA [Paramagnetospirillum magneticum]|uniref:Na(+)/H(+) antiporter NhaA n=1 Tax=Paramagnetospirillum magneticum (strain ATCC 700264 / AMB-1) TaxID=342108 RepID=NHAA_PARM1|nr:Na+/H+ antiporter NhaA [Paramagnetospirillum magneticum]Q2W4H6.1 RecName: Full=Na(+)/H(+) antiporter NhaA; AltName: Full=Sodium/proton antiporter NhaA [Paramagnetospirillum magneticum AMB-1]BAE51249.1 Na+/H+ antiporter [Paramagnetospirillum magneticum AMB-1]